MSHQPLPINLERTVETIMRMNNRGLCNGEEATSEILRAVTDQVDLEMSNSDDHSRNKASNSLLIAVAKTMQVPHGILAAACALSPTGTDLELDQVIVRAIQDIPSIESAVSNYSYDLLGAWLLGGGHLPERFSRELEEGKPLSKPSWLRYLGARNAKDSATQQQLIADDLKAGCPALLLFHLRESGAPKSEVESALSQVDAGALRREQRWGDLASIAVFLAERGWLPWAMQWSTLIDDDQIQPWMTFSDESHHSVLGYRTECAISNDARVFAPLVLIDYLGGDHARALQRVERSLELDTEDERFRHAFGGHRVMLEWVQSRLISDPDDRREALESMQPTKASLGLLRAQIESDIADLAEASGDLETADLKRKRSANIMRNPKVNLYVASFPYDDLLKQLPINASRRNGETS